MNTNHQIAVALVALALGLSDVAVRAQDDGSGPPHHDGPGGPGMHRPPSPLVAALDANHDGVIDATEIANAAGALKALDKNGDGQLTRDELRSPMPGGTNGFAGPRPGGPQGPGEHRPPMPPLIAALDANHDGVVDAKEIANASKSLKALDENADGKLTRDEFGPRWPVRPPGAGTGDGNQDGPPHHHGGGPPPGQE